MQLEGRVALVTGAARRVGAAIARRLSASGMRVALHYRHSQAEAEALCNELNAAGGSARPFRCDLSDGAAARLVRDVIGAFGRLDVLINNASLFEPMRLDQFDLAAWDRTLRVNLTAPMILAHSAAEELRRNKGRMINLLDAATERPWASHIAYCVSKAALQTLTRALARALAPDVNVVGVAPGVVDWPPDYGEELRNALTDRIPLRRAGAPADVAAAIHYLLADGDYITGVTLPVDGGRALA